MTRATLTPPTRTPRTTGGARLRAAAAVVAWAAIACRAPVATRGVGPMAAPPPVEAKDARPSPREVGAPVRAAAAEAPPAVLTIDARVLVTPAGATYLILRAGPVGLGDVLGWDVLYQAGVDTEELSRPEAEAARASAACELLEAFRSLAEMEHLDHLSVTAVLGKPGGSAAIEQRRFARDAGRWRAEGLPSRGDVAQGPALGGLRARDPEEEDRARAAAALFISDVDRADHEAAWSRTSALAKAVMSRAEFDRRLSVLPQVDTANRPELYLAFPASEERFLPGSFVEAWFVRETAAGLLVGALAMRLDDDFEWRVAAVLDVTGPPAPSTVGSTSRPSPEI
jgi:hypothetical protein